MPSATTLSDVYSSLSGEDISDVQSENASEEGNSDYSSDNSLRPSALEQAEQARTTGRRLQLQQATGFADGGSSVPGVLQRESCLPQVYKFFSDGGGEWKTTIPKLNSEFLNYEKTEIFVLKDLVSFSLTDLFSHAWHLLPLTDQGSSYGRFVQLPNPPNVFETHNTERDAVASFLVRTASALDHTRETISHFLLRHAVVKSAVTEEALRLKHCSATLCSLDDLTFKPSWESEVETITNSYLEDDQNEAEVSLFDFSVVFAVPVLDVRMSLQNLQMLDFLVSKCIKRSNFEILSSWGVQHITRVLLYQLELEAQKKWVEDRRWISEAYALLYKIVIVSGDINKLLSLFRWGYRFDKFIDVLSVKGLQTLLCAIEHRNFGRKRLTLPTNVPRGEVVSLHQPFEALSVSTVLGLCVQFQDSTPTVVVVCEKGVFRFSLRAPYELVESNQFYNVTKCMGVYDEGERIAVITTGGVDYLNTLSLHKVETWACPYDETERDAFYVYTGIHRFVKPHVRFGSPARPYFSGDYQSGVMDPLSLSVRRKCESFSVQFCLLPMPPATHTEMKLLTLVSEEKHVVNVSVFLNPNKATLRILFENGTDTFAEVEEPVKLEWVQWSATLQFVNEIASWTIYRNGALCHTKGKSGVLFRPSSQLVVPHLASGMFYGYISSLDVWTKALDVSEMRGTGGERSVLAQFSLFSFNMSEGVGGCLHDTSGKVIWKFKSMQWRNPPSSPPVASPSKQSSVAWKPSGRYYCVTNNIEIAVIEDELATWIDMDGHIIEQTDTKLRPSDCCYYVPKTGKLFLAMQEACGLRIIPTNSPPSDVLNSVPSIIENERFHKRFVDALPRSEGSILSLDFEKYLMLQVNARLLLENSIYHSSHLLLSFTCLSQYCLQTVGRVLCICTELMERIRLNTVKVTDELLLCICGRLLIKETTLMERHCPQKVISSAVEIFDFLQTVDQSSYTFMGEAVSIFRHLHSFMLAECVSHEYQLQLICDSTNLCEIKPLLEPRSVPELVMSVIKKKLKKPLMKFLDRLKKECEVNARAMLLGEKLDFDCAPSMLSALLGMLSQTYFIEWHLVSVALVCSLCKNILRTYEEVFMTSEERKSNTNRLRQTAMGTVIFPVIHYLYDMEWEPSIAADALNVLHSTRQLLVPYSLAVKKYPPQHFTEIHSFTVAAETPLPYTASLSLSHAQSIVVEVAVDSSDSTSGGGELPSVTISVIDSVTLRRSSELVSPGRVQFGAGGLLSIALSGKEATTTKPISFTIHAIVNVVADKSLWISDLCSAFGQVTISTSEGALQRLRKNESGQKCAHPCLFAGGLFDDVLKRVKTLKMSHSAKALDYAKEVQAMLLNLAEGREGILSDVWSNTFEALKPPYKSKLMDAFRWCSCVIAWFTVHSSDTKLVCDALAKAMSWLKKKSFLLLEALQQGKEQSIIERARFLLRLVLPRFFSEKLLQDTMIVEGPVDFTTHSSNNNNNNANISKGFSRGELSVESRVGYSMRPEVKDVASRRIAAASTSRQVLNASVHAFGHTPKPDTELLPNEVLVFLLEQGEADDLSVFSNLLVCRTQQAVLEAIVLDLFREILQTPSKDKSDGLFTLLLNTVVRLKISEGKEESSSTRAEASSSPLSSPLFSKRLQGCGLVCEVKLQKSWGLFIHEVLKELMKSFRTDFELVRGQVIATCAVLCRTWTVLDLQLLRPSEIFEFLSGAMLTALTGKLNDMTLSGDQSTTAYWESKGLFDLFHRCLVVPNSLLQVTEEGVNIISGEVQALHVENASVVCTARNSWKPLVGDCKIRSRFEDSDAYANYGLPCVVSELPDVLYFEVTVDLSLSDVPQLAIGLSGAPVASTETLPPDSIVFGSDGNVSYKDQSVKSIRFSERWRVGDTLGCGVFAPDNSVFFTHNGEFLGVAFPASFRVFIPFVEAHASGTLLKLIVNFGTEQPFKFDLSRVHGLSRCKSVTCSAVCDSVLLTTNYLIASCHSLLANSEGDAPHGDRECASTIVEAAALFLKGQILTLVEQCATLTGSEEEHADTHREQLFLILGRLFHLLTCLLDFFSLAIITRQACLHVYELCALCLSRARDKKTKLLAARCLMTLCEKAHSVFLSECMEQAQQFIHPEETVQCLVDLARLSTTDASNAPLPLPKWSGNTNLVAGKGTFYAASPLPACGTHVIGFRLRRRQQRGQGVGAPLGGCYYIGLSHGHPPISSMASLIGRSDVYILQDTDDQDQVPHLLLRRYSIPRNEHRRIYGNDEIVWIEWNADAGEITYYRENMSLIGLAFANIQRVDNLYPIVYMFNDDASCELVPPPQAVKNSLECWSAYLRRSMAVYTLQQLHTTAYYTSAVSQFVQRCLHVLDRDVQCCSIALALLGGERSFFLCEHDTYGLVVVYAVANVSRRAIVHLATDDSKTLFAVSHDSLKPSFVQTALFAAGGTESNRCAVLLLKELQTCLSEAMIVAPLLCEEQESRVEIEKAFEQSIAEVSTLDMITILQESYANRKTLVKSEPNPFEMTDTFTFRQSSCECLFDITPNVVERFHSSAGLYIPNPSTAVTTGPHCSVIRCAPILQES
ncbi:hypothetical protein STCU_08501, partial [Strigomonas culicis]